ncbi:hypothetical protein H8356DRAFT_1320472 [Neocallimastix lanati (nom. inval.)]|nr:hypothetical protein H8356DRAFT_1320472 [Neocallimastix sp. JGI-2020a]
MRPYGTEDIKTAYRCKGDVCVYEGCTHASQCLFGICALKDEVTNTTRDVPFDNHINGLCRYNAQANITECDAVYVKQTLFRKSRAYMHCGKLKGASCVTDDECAYNLCANGRCARSSNGPSDSDNMIILVYIYLGITLFALVILCPSYCYCYIHQPKNRKKIVLFAVITTFLVLLLWIK